MYLECTQTATWINIEKIPLIKLQCQFIGRKGGQWPHTLHNIKVSDSFLGAHWLQRRNTPCDQSQCLCKLGGTNQYVPPTKKHAHQLLGKMAKKKKKRLVPDLRQGKYKLNLEKQYVLLCPKESDQRIMEACQNHTAGRGSAGQIMTIHEPKW